MMLYDSIIACFGSRFTVLMHPNAKQYRAFPLGTFHYFDWQKSDDIGISISTCPQIISSETAKIGIKVEDVERILPFSEGTIFDTLQQHITPLTTVFDSYDASIGLETKFTFRSTFYPQNFEYSCAPAYCIDIEVHNPTANTINAEIFVELPLPNSEQIPNGIRSITEIVFPDGIDHDGIDNLTFEQIVAGYDVHVDDNGRLYKVISLPAGARESVRFYHIGYIPQATLNQKGRKLKFGYTTLWDDASEVLAWWKYNNEAIALKGELFEATILEASVAPELKDILSSSFKGIASNAWWAENDWFSMMEIGAYHSTLDVDYQLCLFFFQYWTDLVKRMLKQWADYYTPQSGYMAHDVGQHLEATGNRYGGDASAMKVEENCNYLLLLHHYWRTTGDDSLLAENQQIIQELVEFLIDADTTGSGLPNKFADNTNDWGSGLITASEEQSYHGVRLIATYSAVRQIADYLKEPSLQDKCSTQIECINQTLEAGWLGDHYPISFADASSSHHYSMWTTHGLLYPLRSNMNINIDLDKLRIDLISSTRRTMREHGCVHSTVDIRGWLTQNLWRDCIAAYLGIDMSDHVKRYLGHGEYVSYEDTTILEVANELMVVGGAIADHTYAGETHSYPMVDGHPRPACGFGLLYALAGLSYDAITKAIQCAPITFPLEIALTHLADWENEVIPTIRFTRSTANWDNGVQPTTISYQLDNEYLLNDWTITLKDGNND